jgi:hypothetical protein
MTTDSRQRDEYGLRTEIVESQKTQAEFLKWKLIAVALVASISLGVEPNIDFGVTGAKLLICLVPLTCAYVDLISLQILSRILTIGIYLKKSGNSYEQFVSEVRAKTRTNPFVFEAAAMIVSSAVFDAIVVILGFVLPEGPRGWPSKYLSAYILFGAVGMFITVVLWIVHSRRTNEIIRIAEQSIT